MIVTALLLEVNKLDATGLAGLRMLVIPLGSGIKMWRRLDVCGVTELCGPIESMELCGSNEMMELCRRIEIIELCGLLASWTDGLCGFAESCNIESSGLAWIIELCDLFASCKEELCGLVKSCNIEPCGRVWLIELCGLEEVDGGDGLELEIGERVAKVLVR